MALYTTVPAIKSKIMLSALLILTLSCHLAFSFTCHPIHRKPLVVRNAVADPPLMPASDHQDDKRKKNKKNKKNKGNNKNNEEEEEDWTPVEGGFLPNIFRHQRRLNIFSGRRRRKRNTTTDTTTETTTETTADIASPITGITKPKTKSRKNSHHHPNCIEVSDIQSYKTHVADESHSLVVVRFYATWCKSCKASTPLFHSLISRYTSAADGTEDRGPDRLPVKFVQVQLTKETAYLQEGLGVSSVPYVHLYHPEGGLVEERKFSKGYYKDFQAILESYVVGSCDLPEEQMVVDEMVEEEGVFE